MLTGLRCSALLLLLASSVSAQLPEPLAAEPQRIPLPATQRTLVAAARLIAADDPPREITWTGAVCDEAWEPVVGADVWLLPDGPSLQSLGFAPRLRITRPSNAMPGPPFFDDVPLDRLPHVFTDAAGRFAVRGPWQPAGMRGDWTHVGLLNGYVIVSAPGLGVRTVPVRGRRDDSAQDVTDLGDIVLVPEARLVGQVVDENGAPVPFADVRISHMNVAENLPVPSRAFWHGCAVAELHAARTDRDGFYALEGLWPGSITLSVSAPGRGRVEKWGISLAATSRDAAPNQAPPIELPRGGLLEGVVVDASGAPVAGAAVHVSRWIRDDYSYVCTSTPASPGDDLTAYELSVRYDGETLSTRTDRAGRFLVSGMVTDTVHVYAEAQGHEPAVDRDVTVGRRDLRLVLPPEASLDVSVLEADGTAAAGAHVEAYRVAHLAFDRTAGAGVGDVALHVEALPGTPGAFRVHGVGTVQTQLVIAARGHQPVLEDVRGLKPGEHESVEVRLLPAPVISGRVLDEAGQPLAGAKLLLTVLERPGDVIDYTVADAVGEYRFELLTMGSFDLVAEAAGHVRRARTVQLDGAARGTDVEIRLPECAAVAGVVLDAAGQPLPGLAVVVDVPPCGAIGPEESAAAGDQQAVTDRAGRFVLGGRDEGPVQIAVQDFLPQERSLHHGQTERLEFRRGEPPIVHGRVVRRGEPIGDARVRLDVFGAATRRQGFSWAVHDDGTFDIAAPCAGRVVVTAELPTDDPEDSDGPIGYAPLQVVSPSFVLDWGSEVTFEARLPDGLVSGRMVEGNTEAPRAGLYVALCLIEEGGDDGWRVASAHSDSDGRFAFHGLAAGRYVVRAGYDFEAAPLRIGPFDLDADATRSGLLGRVCRGARLSGAALTADGAPEEDGTMVHVRSLTDKELDGEVYVQSGEWRAEGLPGGRYRVSLFRYARANEAPAEWWKDVEVSADGEARVDLKRGDGD